MDNLHFIHALLMLPCLDDTKIHQTEILAYAGNNSISHDLAAGVYS